MHRIIMRITLAAILISAPCLALPERVLSFETGFGSPSLLTARGQVLAFPKIQLGFGLGLIPLLPPFPYQLPAQIVPFADGNFYRVQPTFSITFDIPQFTVRYFPTQRNFYLELNMAILRILMPYVSDLTDVINGTVYPNSLVGTITVYQTLPTISIGHIFSGKAYFFNVSLGFTFFSYTYTTTSISLLNEASLGGQGANDVILNLINSNLQSNLNAAADPFKSLYFCLPSITMTFGIFL